MRIAFLCAAADRDDRRDPNVRGKSQELLYGCRIEPQHCGRLIAVRLGDQQQVSKRDVSLLRAPCLALRPALARE